MLPRFHNLPDWLHWQEQLHACEIDLGLDRVRQVLTAMALPSMPFTVSVAGTNGKGTTVTFLSALFAAAGARVGTYMSPHLFRYNERVCIDGEPVSDAQLCRAFASVDRARGETSLTYFEFGTLAALQIFADEGVDVQVLEVGLGGRLDAVNVVDADVGVVTQIGLDHTEWLGETVEQIALEKAGILRTGRPAIWGPDVLPTAVSAWAERQGICLSRRGEDFGTRLDGVFVGARDYPLSSPDMPAFLRENFSCAMAAYAHWPGAASHPPAVSVAAASRPPGRCQLLSDSPRRIYGDVAHNPDGALALARWVEGLPASRRIAVCGFLERKDAPTVLKKIADVFDEIIVCPLRGQPSWEPDILMAGLPRAQAGSSITQGLQAAVESADADALIVVFGSFFAVAEGMEAANTHATQTVISADRIDQDL